LLLGVLVGVIGAVLLETLRPTVVGAEALEREAGARVLALLPGPPAWIADKDLDALRARLLRASMAAEVTAIDLVGALNEPALRTLAVALESTLTTTDRAGRGAESGLLIRAATLTDLSWPVSAGERWAAVLVAPSVISKRDLNRATAMFSDLSLPLIGIIAYGKRGRRQAAPPRSQGAPPPGKKPADVMVGPSR
jgi:hypothetical protein